MFKIYAEKLIERFIDLKCIIEEKQNTIDQQWKNLERRFCDYFKEDFHQLQQGESDCFLLTNIEKRQMNV